MKLKEFTYNTIRQRILDGTYEPGQQLNEKTILEELGISRTPFREAVSALEQDGLIEVRANHGIYVFQPTAKDVIDLFDVRYLLEPSVAMLACSRIRQEQIDELRRRMNEALEINDLEVMTQEDHYFHEILLREIDNQYFVKIMEQLYASFRIHNVETKRKISLAPSLREHMEILDAIEHRDPEAAAEATKRHLVEARKRASGMIF